MVKDLTMEVLDSRFRYFRLHLAFTQTLLHVWSIEEKLQKRKGGILTMWHFSGHDMKHKTNQDKSNLKGPSSSFIKTLLRFLKISF